MSQIEVEGLCKRYAGQRASARVVALDSLSFVVENTGVFALLGPNGAGKSTTTRILTTLTRPDAGVAVVHGADVARHPDRVRANTGYVSQGTATDPVLTARENLVMAGRLRGMRALDARARADALLHDFGLAGASDRRVSTFSGGMRRRLDVAQSLVHRPAMLFLDEPTTGLDPESRAAMWAEIRRLAAEDAMTVVLSTHYLEEADRLADEVMIIDHGVRVVQGTPTALKSDLHGDTLSVELPEPDEERVRSALLSVPGVTDVVIENRGTSSRLTARTIDGAAAIGPTIAALEAACIPFGAVSASRPTLDDVYLHHVGRSLDTAERGAQEGRAA